MSSIRRNFQNLPAWASRCVAMLVCMAWVCGASMASFGQTVVSYYVNDASGSPVLVTNQDGFPVWKKQYQPFGAKGDGVSNSAQTIGYTGHTLNEATGLVYAGARFYDPVIGRFISPDPVDAFDSNSMSVNRYLYANNNPYKYHDPTGEVFDTIWDAASVVYDLGKIGVGYATNDTALVKEGTVDLAFDLTALAVPGLPAGGSKVARMGANSADALGDMRDAKKVAENADDFFEGTKYTDKVKGQMKQDDFHSFPESVTAFQDAGKVTKLKGGDGVIRDKLEIPGNYRGRDGSFEFIKEADNTINHRLFRPNKE